MAPLLILPVDLLCLGFLIFLAMGVGRLFTHPVLENRGMLSTLTAIATGLMVLAGWIFVLGSMGQLTLLSLLVSLSILTAVAFLTLIRWPLFHWRDVFSRQPSTWSPFEKSLRGILFAMGVACLFFAYAPPTGDDELHYQLALPKLWALTGRLVAIPDNVSSYLPLNAQLLYSALFLLRGPLAAKLLVWGSAGLVALSLWLLASKELKLPRRDALLGIGLFATMPFTVSLTGTTSSDLLAIFYELMALCLVWETWEKRDLRLTFLAGLMAGAAMGTRIYAASFIGALALLLLIHRRPKEMLVMCVAAGLMYLPWLIRNAVLTGNPLFPKALWPGMATDLYFVRESQGHTSAWKGNFWKLPFYLTVGDFTWGMGAVSASLAPLAFFIKKERPQIKKLLFLVIATGVLYAALFPPTILGSTRYYGTSFVLTTVLAAYGSWALTTYWPSRLLPVARAFLIYSMVLPHGLVGFYFGLKRLPFLLGRQSTDAYLQQQYQYAEGYEMLHFIRTTLPKESRVLYLGPNFPAPYYYEPDIHLYGTYHFQPMFYNQSTRDLALALTDAKTSHILLMKKFFTFESDGSARRLEGVWKPPLNIHLPPLTPPYFHALYETPLAVLFEIR